MAEELKLGEYVLHDGISEQDQAVFNYATKGLLGVDYTPKFVATQVVDGVNYLFICEGKTVYPNSKPKIFAIKVYTKFAHSVAPIVEIKSTKECPIETFLNL